MTDRVTFTCNGNVVDVAVEPGESLLSVLRERLGLVSVKDGCAPQGQCGCCTVLVDGDARVGVCHRGRARRGPVGDDRGRSRPRRARRDGRRVRGDRRIAVRLLHARDRDARRRHAPARARSGPGRAPLPVHGLAHGVRSAGNHGGHGRGRRTRSGRGLGARAQLEGGVAQRVDPSVPLGGGGFADDTAPR